jgi:hypothetical protein
MIVGYFLQEIPVRDETVGGRDEFDGGPGLRVSARRLIQGEPLNPIRY